MSELEEEIAAFMNCELDEEMVKQNLSRVDPPANAPPARPITTEAVEAAAERLAAGSFRVVQDIFES